MLCGLLGKVFGDKGYISTELFKTLFERGVVLITQLRRNMKNRLLPLLDKILLREHSLIETVNAELENVSQIEHTRHRAPASFLINLFAGLAAYTFQPKKPRLKLPLALHAANSEIALDFLLGLIQISGFEVSTVGRRQSPARRPLLVHNAGKRAVV